MRQREREKTKKSRRECEGKTGRKKEKVWQRGFDRRRKRKREREREKQTDRKKDWLIDRLTH